MQYRKFFQEMKVTAGPPEDSREYRAARYGKTKMKAGHVRNSGKPIRRDGNIPAKMYAHHGYGKDGHTGRPGDKPGWGTPTPTPPTDVPKADLYKWHSRAVREDRLHELLGKGRLDDLRTHYHTRAVRKRAWAANDPNRGKHANDNVDTHTDQRKLERATVLRNWRDSSHDRQFQRARARKFAHG